jgi:prepilin-type N-terminal cleavage/methylation domain-containing protein
MKTYSRGFTLIEILVVLALMALLFGIGSSMSKFNSEEVLRTQADAVLSALSEARTLTISSAEASQYGVALSSGSVTLFRGAVYNPASSENVVTTLHGAVIIDNITFTGGGSAVVFERFSGDATYPGSLRISLRENPDRFYTISVSATGLIEKN